MGFQVTIKETTREQVKRTRWAKTGKKTEEGDDEYKYVNEEQTEHVDREVYAQKVEYLDLIAVINAVNKKETK